VSNLNQFRGDPCTTFVKLPHTRKRASVNSAQLVNGFSRTVLPVSYPYMYYCTSVVYVMAKLQAFDHTLHQNPCNDLPQKWQRDWTLIHRGM